MSVINQMLKDLDQRQQDQLDDIQQDSNNVFASKMSRKTGLILVLIVIILSALLYSAYLLQQNKKLHQLVQRQNRQVEKIQLQGKRSVTPKNSVQKISVTLLKAQNSQSLTNNISAHQRSKLSVSTKKTTVDKLMSNLAKSRKQINNAMSATLPLSSSRKASVSIPTAKVIVPTKPSMSVSRREISAKQLAKQKMSEAQEAILTNKLAEAEKLFEEILILTPNNKAARKQLAALWFGRKAFQSALNLLSQGMVLDPNNSEYPLMQARIYLSQGDNKQAYKILKAFEQNSDLKYLSTLANLAQQLKKFEEAAITYKHLTSLQPSESRWWLGLAIAYDSNSQYVQALSAYKTIIVQNKLSKSVLIFAQQRIQALKE